MTSSNDQSNIWFGVSMGLLGIIVGYGLALATGRFVQLPVTQDGNKVAVDTNVPDAPVGSVASLAPDPLSVDSLLAAAKAVGVDEAKYKSCVDASTYKDFILKQEDGGKTAGVNGTPGNILVNLQTKKAKLIPGALPFETFEKEIDAMLAGTSTDTVSTDNIPAIDFKREHVTGNAKAKIALIEYADIQCPFCQRVHPTYKQIMTQYGDKIMWVYRHFPLDFHLNALPAAEASECVYAQGGDVKFWEYLDKLHQS